MNAQAEIQMLREECARLRKNRAHQFWGAGENDCPRDIKAGNGELHTLRCKTCGQDNPKGPCSVTAEEVDDYALIMRQGNLLTRTVNVLRGEPAPLHMHSTHDVPELAAALVAERDRLSGLFTAAVALITTERHRQVTEEGYAPAHDDEHKGGEIAEAAACYADAAGAIVRGASPEELHNVPEDFSLYDGEGSGPMWPWSPESFKLASDPVRNLVKAGALIIAEIERIQRMQPQDKWWERQS